MDEAEIEKKATANGWTQPLEFVLGKSLVGGSVTGDVFEGIKPGAIAFQRTQAAPASELPDVAIELAGPWNFYAEFRRGHGLESAASRAAGNCASGGTTLVIPLWLRNETASAQEVALAVDLPAGWKVESGDGKFLVAAKQVAALRVEISLPALNDAKATKQDAQEVTVHGTSNGESIGTVKLRVELRKRALPE